MAERPPLFVGQSRSRDAGEGRLAGGIKVPASDTEAKLPHSPTAKPERTGSGGTACLNFGQVSAPRASPRTPCMRETSPWTRRVLVSQLVEVCAVPERSSGIRPSPLNLILRISSPG